MKHLLYLITLLSILSSCTKQEKKDHLVFNVSGALNTPETNKSTNIIDDIICYRLSDEHLVGNVVRTHLYGDTICMVESSNVISAFNIKTGKFLWKIDSKGRGPYEYSSTYRTLFMPNSIYIDGWANDFKIYDLNGKYVKTLFIDSLSSGSDNLRTYMPERLSYKDNMFVGYHFNRTGLEQEMIIIMDENGNKMTSINRNDILKKRQTMDKGGFGVLYDYDQNLYFWEQPNDTIFKITDNGLDTHIILSRDEVNRISHKIQSDSKKYFLYNFKETQNYLIINTFATKEEGILLCDKRNTNVKFYLNNTLNKFESAIFQNAISNQYSEELITFLYGYEYIEAKEKGEIPVKLSNEDITESSNPLIMKVKLK